MTVSNDLITSKTVTKLEKLLKIELKFQENIRQIHSIKITGDFFIHPEETVETLESSLVGVILEKEALRYKISSVLKDCQLYGFDVDSLVDAIIQCSVRR
ncbi:MAG: lipoate protein ligase C-terminal domain-containing protein [Nitrosopumilaceae archaeon]